MGERAEGWRERDNVLSGMGGMGGVWNDVGLQLELKSLVMRTCYLQGWAWCRQGCMWGF